MSLDENNRQEIEKRIYSLYFFIPTLRSSRGCSRRTRSATSEWPKVHFFIKGIAPTALQSCLVSFLGKWTFCFYTTLLNHCLKNASEASFIPGVPKSQKTRNIREIQFTSYILPKQFDEVFFTIQIKIKRFREIGAREENLRLSTKCTECNLRAVINAKYIQKEIEKFSILNCCCYY